MNGTEKDAIFNLQKYLRQLSYHDTDIINPPIDGIFDSATEASVRSFQKKYNLRETGNVDRTTWELIYSEYLKSRDDFSAPEGLLLFPVLPISYETSAGEISFLVSTIQHILINLKTYYDGFIIETITGIYDDDTEKSIRTFQNIHRLEETGRVNKKTWNRLVRSYNTLAKDYKY